MNVTLLTAGAITPRAGAAATTPVLNPCCRALHWCCRQLENEQRHLERLQLQQDEQQAAAQAAAKAADARRKALKQQLDIQTQIMARSHLKAAAGEEKQHAAELAVQSEARYMQRVVAAEQQAAPVTYFGRKKVEWN